MGNCVAGVDADDLLDHSDVPYLHDSIRVARSDILTTNGELCVIDCVQMAVECLHGKAGTHVPNGDTLICGTTDEEVREWLEVKTVDRVCVLTVLLTNLQSMQIVKLDTTFPTS